MQYFSSNYKYYLRLLFKDKAKFEQQGAFFITPCHWLVNKDQFLHLKSTLIRPSSKSSTNYINQQGLRKFYQCNKIQTLTRRVLITKKFIISLAFCTLKCWKLHSNSLSFSLVSGLRAKNSLSTFEKKVQGKLLTPIN